MRSRQSSANCDLGFELIIDRTWDGEAVDPADRGRVRLSRLDDSFLVTIDAGFADDPPPTGLPGATESLWEHEVVELFVANVETGPARYTEIELSPHGHHLILQFDGIRHRTAALEPTWVETSIHGSRWRGSLELELSHLPSLPWRANAFAIHGRGAARRYLAAAATPGATPDFHQPLLFPKVEL